MVVKCPKCGCEVRNGKYCTRCGSKIEMPSDEGVRQEQRSAVKGGDAANVASDHVTQKAECALILNWGTNRTRSRVS